MCSMLHLFSSFLRHKCSRYVSVTHLLQRKLKEMLWCLKISRRNFYTKNGFLKPERASRLWRIIEFQFDIGAGFLYAWLRQEMLYSLLRYVYDRLDMLLAFKQILKFGSIRVLYMYLLPPFFYKRKQLNWYFEGLCTFLLPRIGMIDSLGRFEDDAGTVNWMLMTWDMSVLRRSLEMNRF